MGSSTNSMESTEGVRLPDLLSSHALIAKESGVLILDSSLYLNPIPKKGLSLISIFTISNCRMIRWDD